MREKSRTMLDDTKELLIIFENNIIDLNGFSKSNQYKHIYFWFCTLTMSITNCLSANLVQNSVNFGELKTALAFFNTRAIADFFSFISLYLKNKNYGCFPVFCSVATKPPPPYFLRKKNKKRYVFSISNHCRKI